jgi:hypothetical protein
MMSKLRICVPVLAAALLAGCNTLETATAPAPEPVSGPGSGARTATLNIPQGSACGAELTAYKSVMDNDLRTGHVNKSVYERVIGELRPAIAACEAGRPSEAIAIMNATKRRHGYPVAAGPAPGQRGPRDQGGG